MHPLLAEIAADPTAAMLLADSGDGAAGIAFPFLLGPAVFLGTYLGIYRYYRNRDKRHEFEKKTDVAVGNLRLGGGLVGGLVELLLGDVAGGGDQDCVGHDGCPFYGVRGSG